MKMSNIYVHGGLFHADDAMCVAIATYINPFVKVERVFKAPETIEDGTVVCDIGFGRYDHHQEDARRRESGEKYAACGLLLEDVWQDIFPDEASYQAFVRDFIIPIELADNGVAVNPLSLAISSFVPAWDSDEEMDAAFQKAVDALHRVLIREVKAAESRIRAESIVQQALSESDGDIVVLPQYAPWDMLCSDRYTAKFVVYPSNRGGYNLQTITVEPDSFQSKQALPAEWLDKKPEGCTFVHQGRFIAAFDTLEQAIAAAKAI